MSSVATIAEEHGLSNTAVRRAVEFGRGLDAAEKVSPGIKDAVLAGKVKAPKVETQAQRDSITRKMKKAPDKKSEA